MFLPSVRAAATRTVAGGLLVCSLLGLVGWASAIAGQVPFLLSASDPRAAALSLALAITVTATFAGVSVAAVGLVTETFARHREGYFRAMRVCGAVGLVGVGCTILLSAVGAL